MYKIERMKLADSEWSALRFTEDDVVFHGLAITLETVRLLILTSCGEDVPDYRIVQVETGRVVQTFKGSRE